jgi:hypothetical protein
MAKQLHRGIGRSVRTLALALAVLVVPAALAPAQVVVSGGYGLPWGGYGVVPGPIAPGFGYGYAYPIYGHPYAAPGFGYGYPYGAPGFGYGYYGYPYGVPDLSARNPLFAAGLTPLAVQGALAERALSGRGIPPISIPGVIEFPPADPGTGLGADRPEGQAAPPSIPSEPRDAGQDSTHRPADGGRAPAPEPEPRTLPAPPRP